jgi:hypothetical protein
LFVICHSSFVIGHAKRSFAVLTSMPPIDLPKVRLRAAALAEPPAEIAAVLAGVRSLLEDHSDFSHRLSQKLGASVPPNTFKTPMPVVRQIITALRKPVQADPVAALDLIKGLWARGSREERRIAAELLGIAAPHVPSEALGLMEAWLREIESGETADALAEHGLGPLLRADPQTHMPHIRRWVEQPYKWTRRFGLAALDTAAKDKKWDDVPEALSILHVVMSEFEPEVRRAVVAVLNDLILKSPVEVNVFLKEEALRTNHNTHLIIRAVLPRLDAEVQAELVKTMRA